MFDRVLIANRGEIACRVIRSCKRLGIETVAVHSEVDADALHVQMADRAVFIGPAPAAESYLAIDKILDAIKATGAQAVHPGYGFLSENSAFAEALAAENVAFIGPPVGAIQAMGDKIESKKLAKSAGVSTVPGHNEAISEPDQAVKIADEIGYPVMVKASAGGGGKGMRIARSAEEVREGLDRARSEAASSFGDDRCFIEKFVEQPRHIEIQVLGDKHGNVVYLFERECSIQRRHQKVVEEAPSPFLDEATRRAMGEQAVALAKAVDYHSAGTVEFIVDAERNFYFLEMNTRLQVEHPVTELITGVDLVEQMIRVAAGEKLAFAQDDLSFDGWAIESRVYAEDPTRGFLPSIGRLVRYREPVGPQVRVDSGVREGGEVSMFYDPMIAKLCTFGPDRATAIAAMQDALDGFVIRGVGHNVTFLAAVMANEKFRDGDMSTNFIAQEYGPRFEGLVPGDAQARALALIALALRLSEAEEAGAISGQLPGYRHRPPQAWTVELDGERFDFEVAAREGAAFDLTAGELTHTVTLNRRPGALLVEAWVDGERVLLQADPVSEGYRLTHGGLELPALVRTRKAADFAARMPPKIKPDTSKMVFSPMPGLIRAIRVEAGQEIKAGQDIVILEAMKMENVLRAEVDGTVKAVKVQPGESVAADALLVEFA